MADDTAAAEKPLENDGSQDDKSKVNPCVVCKTVSKSKYNVERKSGKTSYLCSDECFAEFRQNPVQFLKAEQTGTTDTIQATSSSEKCAQCNKSEFSMKLCWQSLMFCSEKCLEVYQGSNMGMPHPSLICVAYHLTCHSRQRLWILRQRRGTEHSRSIFFGISTDASTILFSWLHGRLPAAQ